MTAMCVGMFLLFTLCVIGYKYTDKKCEFNQYMLKQALQCIVNEMGLNQEAYQLFQL